MQIIQSTSHPDLQKRFWSFFRKALEDLAPREDICIWLSGGSSLDIFYSHIWEYFHTIPEDIRKKICFAFLDERVVPVDHPDSNEWQLRNKFLNKLIEDRLIDDSQIIGITDSSSLRGMKRCSVPGNTEYGLLHASQWQIHSTWWQILIWADEYSFRVPHIDIALFGVGPDGHIASLFPHHPLLSSLGHTYLEITDSPKPPSHRITVSPRMIEDISHIFVAIMQGKEEVFHRLWDPEVSVEDCPVKMLLESDRLVVMSDIET